MSFICDQGPVQGQGRAMNPWLAATAPQSLRLCHNAASLLWWHRCVHNKSEYMWSLCVFVCACMLSLCLHASVYVHRTVVASAALVDLGHMSWRLCGAFGVWCRALSCLTFTANPWTSTPSVTSFLWQFGACMSIGLSCSVKFSLYVILKSPRILKAFWRISLEINWHEM